MNGICLSSETSNLSYVFGIGAGVEEYDCEAEVSFDKYYETVKVSLSTPVQAPMLQQSAVMISVNGVSYSDSTGAYELTYTPGGVAFYVTVSGGSGTGEYSLTVAQEKKPDGTAAAEGYVVILVFVSVMAIVLALNVFSYLTLRQDIDYIAGAMADAAAMEGLTESRELDKLFKTLCENAGVDADYEITTDEYYNRTKREVQLGDPLTVTVTCETTFKGLGQLGASIEMDVSVSKTSLSRVYFKD